MWLNSQLTSSDQMMRGMHYPHDTTGPTPIRIQLFLKKLHVSSEQGIETFHPQMHTFGNCYKTQCKTQCDQIYNTVLQSCTNI